VVVEWAEKYLNQGEKVHVLHIGNEHSFEEGRLPLFESKSMKDYNEDRDGNIYGMLLLGILPELDMTVLGCVPYRSVKEERVPDKSWMKAGI
jgi:hypothetical protein